MEGWHVAMCHRLLSYSGAETWSTTVEVGEMPFEIYVLKLFSKEFTTSFWNLIVPFFLKNRKVVTTNLKWRCMFGKRRDELASFYVEKGPMEFTWDFSKDPMEEAPKCGYIETTWLTLGCIRGCNFATNLQPILLHDLVIETQKQKQKQKEHAHTIVQDFIDRSGTHFLGSY